MYGAVHFFTGNSLWGFMFARKSVFVSLWLSVGHHGIWKDAVHFLQVYFSGKKTNNQTPTVHPHCNITRFLRKIMEVIYNGQIGLVLVFKNSFPVSYTQITNFSQYAPYFSPLGRGLINQYCQFFTLVEP